MNPFIRKYLPKSSKDIIGQDSAVKDITNFLKNYKKSKKKALLAYGSPGSGKTSAIYAIGEELNFEIIEVNASDFRNAEKINAKIGPAINQRSLFGKEKLILLDEVDGLSGTKDRGGIPAIVKLIDSSTFPIILTANNPWDSKFATLRKRTDLVNFHDLDYRSIANILKKIAEKENITYDEVALKTLARRAGGDARAAINDLETLTRKDKKLSKESLENLGERNKMETMLSALVKVLKSTDPKIAISAFDNVNEDIDQRMLWLEENIAKEYKNKKDLARAYEALAKADVFRGRIRRWQHWRFLVYVNALMTIGVATAKDEKYKEYVKYEPTKRLLSIWMLNRKYMKRKAIAEKIANKTHTSKRRVIQDTLPYIKDIFKSKDGSKLAEYFELDKEEVAWLKK